MTKIDELNFDLTVCENINRRLGETVLNIHQAQTISEKYSRRNNVEMAGITNSFRDNGIEGIVIEFCKEHRIDVEPMAFEAYLSLPLSNTKAFQDPEQSKQVFTRFVKRRHSIYLLQAK